VIKSSKKTIRKTTFLSVYPAGQNKATPAPDRPETAPDLLFSRSGRHNCGTSPMYANQHRNTLFFLRLLMNAKVLHTAEVEKYF
jgi:hypothetical protein